MVQLKDIRKDYLHKVSTFQFQYGTIKRGVNRFFFSHFYNFNSNMVQLKGGYEKDKPLIVVFQFQYGTIKRKSRMV